MTEPIITWLNGLSVLFLVSTAWFVVIVSIYYYKKEKTRVWITGMALGTAVALGWTGIASTFVSILVFGYNIPLVKFFIMYLTYSTIPVGALAIIYTSWDVTGSPHYKKYVLYGFVIYSAIYYVLFYVTANHAVLIPDVPAGEMYDDWINPGSVFYYVLWGEVAITAVIAGVGFYKFRLSSPESLKRKTLYVIIAVPIIGGSILLDTVVFMEWAVNILSIPRFGMVIGLLLLYFGFKPTKSE